MLDISPLPNGIVLIVEEMAHVESAAIEISFPGGIVMDPEGRVGQSVVLSDMLSRGAGKLSSRELSDAFDSIGARHSESSHSDRLGFKSVLLAEDLKRVVELIGLMINSPDFPSEHLESVKSLLIQDIKAIDDNPARKAMHELYRRYLPAPFSRPGTGSIEGVSGVEIQHLRDCWQERRKARGVIVSVAGNVKTTEVRELIEAEFGGLEGECLTRPEFGPVNLGFSEHIESDSAQLQIVGVYPSVAFDSDDYYTAKLLAGVLSGGMFGRLFIEVREKRGLCYSVYCRHSSHREYGNMSFYAGTTPERAQETLDVTMEVLRGIPGTVTQEELERARANLLASLVIGEESSGSRASSNCSDWWLSGRIRTLDQIREKVEAVTLGQLDAHAEQYAPSKLSALTLGSRKLEVPS